MEALARKELQHFFSFFIPLGHHYIVLFSSCLCCTCSTSNGKDPCAQVKYDAVFLIVIPWSECSAWIPLCSRKHTQATCYYYQRDYMLSSPWFFYLLFILVFTTTLVSCGTSRWLHRATKQQVFFLKKSLHAGGFYKSIFICKTWC